MVQLKGLEAEHPELITADSPTQRVGGKPRAGFETYRHKVPMVSLDNAFSFEELADFDRRVRELSGREKVDYVAEHKFDGLSMALIYEDGLLVRGVTRGDGTTGEDVTANVKTIRSIPLRLDAAALKKAGLRGDLEVRGEAIMTRKAFELLNEQQEEAGREAVCESAECGGWGGAGVGSGDYGFAAVGFLCLLLADGWTAGFEAAFFEFGSFEHDAFQELLWRCEGLSWD